MSLMLPKVDIAFKLLSGDERSKNILTDFLQAALPELAETGPFGGFPPRVLRVGIKIASFESKYID